MTKSKPRIYGPGKRKDTGSKLFNSDQPPEWDPAIRIPDPDPLLLRLQEVHGGDVQCK